MVNKTVPYDVFEEVRKALQEANSQYLNILDSWVCYGVISYCGEADYLWKAQ
jgi:hypothetical protein